MSREEFINTLQRKLNSEMDPAQVQSNLSYYQNYIQEEMAKGQTEEQVLEKLGPPELIAKSILDASAPTEEPNQQRSDYEDNDENQEDFRLHQNLFGGIEFSGINCLLIAIIVIVLLCMIFGTFFRMFGKYLIPVIVIVLIIRWIRSKM